MPRLKPKAYWRELKFPETNADRTAGLTAVYLISSPPFIKVGIARDPRRRFEMLSCDNPHPTHLIGVWWLPHGVARLAEAYCHTELMDHHHLGEWFRAPVTHARDVCDAVCRNAARSRGTIVKFDGSSLNRKVDRRPKNEPQGVRRVAAIRRESRDSYRDEQTEQQNSDKSQEAK